MCSPYARLKKNVFRCCCFFDYFIFLTNELYCIIKTLFDFENKYFIDCILLIYAYARNANCDFSTCAG